MDLHLTRTDNGPAGIFGTLTTSGGAVVAVTLEHAYPEDQGWVPKIPVGTYVCVRGEHQLGTGSPFTTFEITGVPGHSGLLFHTGNFTRDSSGCVLVGQERHDDMILGSHAAFGGFMLLMGGVDRFTLAVS